MNAQDMADHLELLFEEIRRTRRAGQAEYAHKDSDAFANFKRVSERMGMKPLQVLMVYVEKHMDGVHSYIQGHRSQREPIHGRIKDIIVYMMLADAMITEEENEDLVSGTSGHSFQPIQLSRQLGSHPEDNENLP